MSEIIVLWAQALDNDSPAHIVFCGEYLSPEKNSQRVQATTKVSSVTKVGLIVFDQDGVQLTVDGRQFVVKLIGKEPDSAGRLAPLVLYSDCGNDPPDELASWVFSQVADFAARIGRTIPDYKSLLLEAFNAAKKKRSVRMVRIALLAAGTVLAAGLIYILYAKKI